MNNNLYIIINDFLHDTLVPTIQCVNSYRILLKNPAIDIDKKRIIEILDIILKRCNDIREGLLDIINKEEENGKNSSMVR